MLSPVYAKFGDDRFGNEKALAGRRSDNNNTGKKNKNMNNVGGRLGTRFRVKKC